MQAHSVQQTWLGYAVTVAIIMFIMALRFRCMGQIRPLKLETLWIVPAIYLVVAVLMFRQLPPTGWVGFASAAGLFVGAAVGWQRGKMMHIHVDSQTHALNQKASPAAMMFLMALIAVRISGQGFLGSEGVSPAMLTDPLVAFAFGMFMLTRIEIYLRARRMLGEALGRS